MLTGAPSGNLDLLRSLAVLAVMLDHLIPTLLRCGVPVSATLAALTAHVGQAGVLAFFVHTSLVLMFSLERLAAESPASLDRHTVGRFYVRRLLRIYPLALVCIALVLAFDLPAMTWRETPPVTPAVVLANLLLVQNLVTGQSVLGPLWSLPYEVEMYVVLPALFVLARRPRGPQALLALIGLAGVGALWLGSITGGRLNMAAYLPVFLCGVAVYAWRGRVRPWLPAWGWPLLLLALFGLYALVHRGRQGPDTVIGWLFGALLALAVLGGGEVAAHRPRVRVAQVVARYSYGLYLLHVPVLHVVYQLWAPASVTAGVLAYVGLTFVASFVAYHLIEAPMVAMGQRFGAVPRSATRPGPSRTGKIEVPLPSSRLAELALRP
jgi:peptidoglycan/LPS O-acetylase OafA/YrhL